MVAGGTGRRTPQAPSHAPTRERPREMRGRERDDGRRWQVEAPQPPATHPECVASGRGKRPRTHAREDASMALSLRAPENARQLLKQRLERTRVYYLLGSCPAEARPPLVAASSTAGCTQAANLHACCAACRFQVLQPVTTPVCIAWRSRPKEHELYCTKSLAVRVVPNPHECPHPVHATYLGGGHTAVHTTVPEMYHTSAVQVS